MTEKEKIEMLMMVRYKVVMRYPGMSFKYNEVIVLDKVNEDKRFDEGVYYCYHNGNGATAEYDFVDYPDIFRKLEWWEERKPEEMPEYVKDEVTGKILKIEYRIDSHTPCDVITWNESDKPFWNILHELVPATESEYLAYINSPTPAQ